MRVFSSLFALSIALAGGMAVAQDATDPTVIARQAVMKQIGGSMKVLGDMAGGKTAFDAAKAAEAKAALIAAAGEVPAKFEPQATDPASEAKPEIWTGWNDFVTKSSALGTAATAVDTTSVDGIKAGLGAVGGACKDCHTTYRM